MLQKRDCPYYPCTFEGQDCTFCFCPMYPCRDTRCGKWFTTSQGFMVWDCSKCTTIHKPEVVEYLQLDPKEIDEEKINVAKRKLKMYLEC